MEETQLMATQRLDFSDEEVEEDSDEKVVGHLTLADQEFPVVVGENKIGRDPASCQIVLAQQPSLSRVHAVIEAESDGTASVYDTGSSNGSKAPGGGRMKPNIRYNLNTGDTIVLGSLVGVWRRRRRAASEPAGETMESGTDTHKTKETTEEDEETSSECSNVSESLFDMEEEEDEGDGEDGEYGEDGDDGGDGNPGVAAGKFVPETPAVVKRKPLLEPGDLTFLPETQSSPLPTSSRIQQADSFSMVPDSPAGVSDLDTSSFLAPSQQPVMVQRPPKLAGSFAPSSNKTSTQAIGQDEADSSSVSIVGESDDEDSNDRDSQRTDNDTTLSNAGENPVETGMTDSELIFAPTQAPSDNSAGDRVDNTDLTTEREALAAPTDGIGKSFSDSELLGAPTQAVCGKLSESELFGAPKLSDSELLGAPTQAIADKLSESELLSAPTQAFSYKLSDSELLGAPTQEINNRLSDSELLGAPTQAITNKLSDSELIGAPTQTIGSTHSDSELLGAPTQVIHDRLSDSELLGAPTQMITEKAVVSEEMDESKQGIQNKSTDLTLTPTSASLAEPTDFQSVEANVSSKITAPEHTSPDSGLDPSVATPSSENLSIVKEPFVPVVENSNADQKELDSQTEIEAEDQIRETATNNPATDLDEITPASHSEEDTSLFSQSTHNTTMDADTQAPPSSPTFHVAQSETVPVCANEKTRDNAEGLRTSNGSLKEHEQDDTDETEKKADVNDENVLLDTSFVPATQSEEDLGEPKNPVQDDDFGDDDEFECSLNILQDSEIIVPTQSTNNALARLNGSSNLSKQISDSSSLNSQDIKDSQQSHSSDMQFSFIASSQDVKNQPRQLIGTGSGGPLANTTYSSVTMEQTKVVESEIMSGEDQTPELGKKFPRTPDKGHSSLLEDSSPIFTKNRSGSQSISQDVSSFKLHLSESCSETFVDSPIFSKNASKFGQNNSASTSSLKEVDNDKESMGTVTLEKSRDNRVELYDGVNNHSSDQESEKPNEGRQITGIEPILLDGHKTPEIVSRPDSEPMMPPTQCLVGNMTEEDLSDNDLMHETEEDTEDSKEAKKDEDIGTSVATTVEAVSSFPLNCDSSRRSGRIKRPSAKALAMEEDKENNDSESESNVSAPQIQLAKRGRQRISGEGSSVSLPDNKKENDPVSNSSSVVSLTEKVVSNIESAVVDKSKGISVEKPLIALTETTGNTSGRGRKSQKSAKSVGNVDSDHQIEDTKQNISSSKLKTTRKQRTKQSDAINVSNMNGVIDLPIDANITVESAALEDASNRRTSGRMRKPTRKIMEAMKEPSEEPKTTKRGRRSRAVLETTRAKIETAQVVGNTEPVTCTETPTEKELETTEPVTNTEASIETETLPEDSEMATQLYQVPADGIMPVDTEEKNEDDDKPTQLYVAEVKNKVAVVEDLDEETTDKTTQVYVGLPAKSGDPEVLFPGDESLTDISDLPTQSSESTEMTKIEMPKHPDKDTEVFDQPEDTTEILTKPIVKRFVRFSSGRRQSKVSISSLVKDDSSEDITTTIVAPVASEFKHPDNVERLAEEAGSKSNPIGQVTTDVKETVGEEEKTEIKTEVKKRGRKPKKIQDEQACLKGVKREGIQGDKAILATPPKRSRRGRMDSEPTETKEESTDTASVKEGVIENPTRRRGQKKIAATSTPVTATITAGGKQRTVSSSSLSSRSSRSRSASLKSVSEVSSEVSTIEGGEEATTRFTRVREKRKREEDAEVSGTGAVLENSGKRRRGEGVGGGGIMSKSHNVDDHADSTAASVLIAGKKRGRRAAVKVAEDAAGKVEEVEAIDTICTVKESRSKRGRKAQLKSDEKEEETSVCIVETGKKRGGRKPGGKVESVDKMDPTVSTEVSGKRRGRKAQILEETSSTVEEAGLSQSRGESGKRRGRKPAVKKEEEEDTDVATRSGSTGRDRRNRAGGSDSEKASEESVCASPSLRRAAQASVKFRVMFTGYQNQKDSDIVEELGGTISESSADCTVLVTDQIKRTAKFLCMVSRGGPVVSPLWISESKKSGHFLDPWNFILKDEANEKKWGFRLESTLWQAARARLFAGVAVYVTPQVKPPPDQFKEIIESGDGVYLPTLPPKEGSETAAYVISCPEDKSLHAKIRRSGFTIMDKELVLSGILKYKIDPKLELQ